MHNEIPGTNPQTRDAPTAPTFAWQVRGRAISVAYDVAGDGPPVLLLPAMSTVSTRAEMYPLARQLQRRFRTVTVDWPGFGAVSRPRLRWRPEFYAAFLRDFCEHLFDGPVAVAAAGHSCAYVLQLARDRPATWSRIILIAPTWLGPLPVVMGDYRRAYSLLRRLVELPLLGEAIYRLNTASPVLARMYREHVYGNPGRD